MIEDLLPPAVISADGFHDPAQPALFAQEARLLAGWGEERAREFGTVRILARRALNDLGVAPVPILPGEHGAPRWPAGVVGSMTHCPGYRAAAVAHAAQIRSIGVDAEPALPLPADVHQLVVRPEERRPLQRLADAQPGVCWDRLLFCAKEAVYKAWFPLTARWLGFDDINIEINPHGTFTAAILAPARGLGGPPIDGFAGRWLARHGLLLAAFADSEC